MSNREPRVTFLSDGRNVRLEERLTFLDRAGRTWAAPRGTVVNGASIPRFFWRVIGCPFTGKYRNATILHDYYCDLRRPSSKNVHAMFHEKMICDGVGPVQAFVMWAAVRVFGPRF